MKATKVVAAIMFRSTRGGVYRVVSRGTVRSSTRQSRLTDHTQARIVAYPVIVVFVRLLTGSCGNLRPLGTEEIGPKGGVTSDIMLARSWYEKARDLDSTIAPERIFRLSQLRE